MWPARHPAARAVHLGDRRFRHLRANGTCMNLSCHSPVGLAIFATLSLLTAACSSPSGTFAFDASQSHVYRLTSIRVAQGTCDPSQAVPNTAVPSPSFIAIRGGFLGYSAVSCDSTADCEAAATGKPRSAGLGAWITFFPAFLFEKTSGNTGCSGTTVEWRGEGVGGAVLRMDELEHSLENIPTDAKGECSLDAAKAAAGKKVCATSTRYEGALVASY